MSAAVMGVQAFVDSQGHKPRLPKGLSTGQLTTRQSPTRKAEAEALKVSVPKTKLRVSRPSSRSPDATLDRPHQTSPPRSREPSPPAALGNKNSNQAGHRDIFDVTDLSDIDTSTLTEDTLPRLPHAGSPVADQRQNSQSHGQGGKSQGDDRFSDDFFEDENVDGCQRGKHQSVPEEQRGPGGNEQANGKDPRTQPLDIFNVHDHARMLEVARQGVESQQAYSRHEFTVADRPKGDAERPSINGSHSVSAWSRGLNYVRTAPQGPDPQGFSFQPAALSRTNGAPKHHHHRSASAEMPHTDNTRPPHAFQSRAKPLEPWQKGRQTRPQEAPHNSSRQQLYSHASKPHQPNFYEHSRISGLEPRSQENHPHPPPPTHAPPPLPTPANEDDLDLPVSTLSTIPYSTLAAQSLDHQPHDPSPVLPTKHRDQPLPQQLVHLQKLSADQQSAFFATATAAQWEECGEWFVGRFAELVKRIGEARRRKREAIARFEDAMKERDEQVLARKDETERVLGELKNGGARLLRESVGSK
ncbi:MAG: hypothetical protein M1833_004032 [Piccolia ochrophora]|nr:MAG: hypothetical protein M1833_004032 [Piccolia ochrophora]